MRSAYRRPACRSAGVGSVHGVPGCRSLLAGFREGGEPRAAAATIVPGAVGRRGDRTDSLDCRTASRSTGPSVRHSSRPATSRRGRASSIGGVIAPGFLVGSPRLLRAPDPEADPEPCGSDPRDAVEAERPDHVRHALSERVLRSAAAPGRSGEHSGGGVGGAGRPAASRPLAAMIPGVRAQGMGWFRAPEAAVRSSGLATSEERPARGSVGGSATCGRSSATACRGGPERAGSDAATGHVGVASSRQRESRLRELQADHLLRDGRTR